ncbi:probable tubulin polyglutamylase TTLL2 [Erpetoichthys calabaricus]|uniref:probable tubulin polyglutamylase TTLL2 n=1 Tax=Erpetoichthys calabaricus TaxID=27687 RepID=UPI00223469A7|nr:probable tubulin polyglutamylase TTLL2 [Erpetoichthys calabaricus]XP_051780540.1 probable tubulin polyglutamylase TTLL2 [Erpetoichthys calabaricus]XP_051780541.1 probable tubulin polyglutamylase TTLL2 [Erpetoichthys calabaricus]
MMAGADVTDAPKKPLVFRLYSGVPEVVRQVLLERGWIEYNEQEHDEKDWNLYWRTTSFTEAEYENILPWQRLNHHPKTMGITRKDCLARNLKRMKGIYGSALYDFSPVAFILPNDYTKFLAEYSREMLENGGTPGYWICKPVDLSRGRGIFIFQDFTNLAYDSSVIVQKYISNPLLISGYKFDLRIYVCVKSFHPLTVYMYQEGLVRFATEKYSLNSLDNQYAHLTNTSINKFGLSYNSEKERVGSGCKWTMSKFRTYLHSLNINEMLLWQRINSIVTLTLLTIASSIPASPNCVELFGFDILIDSNFKPWLLEVNFSPALSLDCPVDVTVKKGLLHDLIDLLNYSDVDHLRESAFAQQAQKRPSYVRLQPLSLTKPVVLLLANTLKRSCKDCNLAQPTCSPHSTLHNPCKANYLEINKEEHCEKLLSDTARISCVQYGKQKVTKVSKVSLTRKTHPSTSSPQKETGLACKKSPQPKKKIASQNMENVPSNKNLCTLPAINKTTHKPASFKRFSKVESIMPRSRVGDFILTFPFNEATVKASQKLTNVKAAILEVQKLLNSIVSHKGCGMKRRKEDISSNCRFVGKEQNGQLLWGPKDPPLLSVMCTNNHNDSFR